METEAFAAPHAMQKPASAGTAMRRGLEVLTTEHKPFQTHPTHRLLDSPSPTRQHVEFQLQCLAG